MAEVTAWEREQAARLNEENFRRVRESGQVKIHMQTAEEKERWKESLSPLYQKFRSMPGGELLDEVLRVKGSL